MAVFYLETSALLKRYKNEVGTQVVDSLFADRPPGDTFLTSRLTLVEIPAGVARAFAGGLETRNGILVSFAADLRMIEVSEVSLNILQGAATAATQFRLRALDSIHLAVARDAFTREPSIILVTADKELVAAGRAAGLAVLDPAEPDAMEALARLRA